MDMLRKYKQKKKRTDRTSTQSSVDSGTSGMQSGTRSSIDSSAPSTSNPSGRPSITSSGFASTSIRTSFDSTSAVPNIASTSELTANMGQSSFESASGMPIIESGSEGVATPMQVTAVPGAACKQLEMLDPVAEETEISRPKASTMRRIFGAFGRSKGRTPKDQSSSKSLGRKKEQSEHRQATAEASIEGTEEPRRRRRSLFRSIFRRRREPETRVIEDASAHQESLVQTGLSSADPPDSLQTEPVVRPRRRSFIRRMFATVTRRNTGQYYDHGRSILDSPSPDGTEPPPPPPPTYPNPKATRPPKNLDLGDSFVASVESDPSDKDYVKQPDTEEEILYTSPSDIISPKDKDSDKFKF